MTRIQETFRNLNRRGEGALVAYVTAGDPAPKYTPRIVEALIDGGADVVELGIPFSDPIADGRTIQAASSRALEAGTTPLTVLDIAKKIRKKFETPLVVLTYYNLIYRRGLRDFMRLADTCGVDGLIVPDLPVEEAVDYKSAADARGVDTVFLAAPSTSPQRLERIIDHTSGFLYVVSLFGVTGAREKVENSTKKMIAEFKPHTKGRIPIAVGFGVSKPEHVATLVRAGADGAIVGSAFVDAIQANIQNMRTISNMLERMACRLKRSTVHQ